MTLTRPTKFHQRRHAMMVAAFERLGKNDDYRFLIVSGGEALRQKDNDAGRSIAQALVDIVCREEPDYVRLVGRNELLRELSTLISAQAGTMRYPEVTDDDAAGVVGRKGDAFTATKQLSPGNSAVSLLRGNALVKPGASKADLAELGSYLSSVGPERRGRRKGAKDARPRKQRYPALTGQAGAAYNALAKGATKKAVISTLWLELDPLSSASYRKLADLIAPIVAERGDPRPD